LFVVEVDEERPVDVPCTRMELGESGWFCGCEEGGRRVRVDDISKVFSSSRATSHLLVRMSEASLP